MKQMVKELKLSEELAVKKCEDTILNCTKEIEDVTKRL